MPLSTPKLRIVVDIDQFVIKISSGTNLASFSIDVVTEKMCETSRANVHTKYLLSLAMRGAQAQVQDTVGLDDGTA